MKTSILRYHDQHASILVLEPAVQKGIHELGLAAIDLLHQQNTSLWAEASTSTFLDELQQGAAYLGLIGCEAGPRVLVSDPVAHRAFITCLFMAAQGRRLCSQCRADVQLALQILAECCPVGLPVGNLPEPSELSAKLHQQAIVQKHFPAMLKAGYSYRLTLADALRLLAALERAPSSKLVHLMANLREVTEGLRMALRQTEGKKP